MTTEVSIPQVLDYLNKVGLSVEFCDTTTEVPCVTIENLFTLGLPDSAHPNSEFYGFTLQEDPNEGSGDFFEGDMFWLLGHVYKYELEQIGWFVQDLNMGNEVCPIYNIEKGYPFEEDVRYVLTCPNSMNDNVDNEEFNTFNVIVAPKGDEGEDFDWSNSKEFKTITEVIEFIYGEE